MLSNILNDPEKMKSIMSIASSFLGQNAGGGAAPFTPPQEPVQPVSEPIPPIQNDVRPTSAFPGAGSAAYDPSVELMSKAIPLISAIAKSGKNAIDQNKMNLLLSLKPFVTNDVSSQMDHAIRVLSMARMAKAAMGQIGNIAGSDGKTEL